LEASPSWGAQQQLLFLVLLDGETAGDFLFGEPKSIHLFVAS
jgi:hypothetical protein